MDSPYNILQSILNDTSMIAENDKAETLKEYISEESILAIEYNIDFFNHIPKDNLKKVLEDFIEIVFYYERDLYRYYTDSETQIRALMATKPDSSFFKLGDSTIRSILFKDKKIPSKLKKDDLVILTKYQEMLSRLFPFQACNYPRMYINDSEKDISIIYDINQKLINDLKNEDFNIIDKSNYHKKQAPTKTNIKKFLQNIRHKYHLKGVSIEEKQLVDTLESSANRSLPTID